MQHWIDEMVFPDGWEDLRGFAEPDARRRTWLTEELTRELAVGHELNAVGWTLVAAAVGRDDVVLSLDDQRAAIVHLTYTRTPPERLPWPITETASSVTELTEVFLDRQ